MVLSICTKFPEDITDGFTATHLIMLYICTKFRKMLKISKGHNFIKNVGRASLHQISVSAFGESLGNSSNISVCVCLIVMSFYLIFGSAFVELL